MDLRDESGSSYGLDMDLELLDPYLIDAEAKQFSVRDCEEGKESRSGWRLNPELWRTSLRSVDRAAAVCRGHCGHGS